ncbi:cyclophilin-like fold protein [Streptomyces sp. NPDC056333]|uniref:cyclophilin-like fold protein n=1 Tax=Streptomyces sp. NPDC056333 TaxID=3345786 RepID=UPI0035D78CFF
MNIRLTINGHRIDAVLNDSAAAHDFASLLPLTLGLKDFHERERSPTCHGSWTPPVPRTRPTARPGIWRTAHRGRTWPFHRAGETSPGLVILGHLSDSKDIDRLATADRVTIEAPA